jgi:hypothetical protein
LGGGGCLADVSLDALLTQAQVAALSHRSHWDHFISHGVTQPDLLVRASPLFSFT